MSIKVRMLHPVAEKVARMLSGINTVPKNCADRMVARVVNYLDKTLSEQTSPGNEDVIKIMPYDYSVGNQHKDTK